MKKLRGPFNSNVIVKSSNASPFPCIFFSNPALISFSLLTPIFLTLSFPKFDLSILVWIALIPLLLSIKRLNTLKAFLLSWILGTLSFMGIFFWINQVNNFTVLHFVVTGLYLGIYFGIFAILTKIFIKSNWFYPIWVGITWVCIEYLRSNLFYLAFPWALLGHTQYRNLNLIQISSFTGVYGISFLIALVNCSLAESLEFIILYAKRAKDMNNNLYPINILVYLIPLLFIPCMIILGKNIRMDKKWPSKINVGLVQGNIAQKIKWDREILGKTIDIYERLTIQVSQDNPSLIIWPETSIPIDFHSFPKQLWRIVNIARKAGIPFVCGAAGSPKIGQVKKDNNYRFYNSAFYISSTGGIEGEYKKIKLLPFAEFIPQIGNFSFKTIFPELRGNFIPGHDIKTFPLAGESFGVTICWENIFPDLFRRFVLKYPSFMVNISNDAWFKDSAGPYQHLICSIFRAVENRISIARVANTGISCFIDPYGEIMERITDKDGNVLNIRGIATKEIPLSREQTFYTKYGDIFMFICIAFFHIGIVIKLTKYGLVRLTHNPNKSKGCKANSCFRYIWSLI